jgi:CelD/BcsL family acetyltransferase involved in cellulose biosynthesis
VSALLQPGGNLTEGGPLKVSVVRPGELGPAELQRWRLMQVSDPHLQNPFLSPEFTLAVARVRDDARVAVLEREGSIVGFLPYQLGRFGAGRPIGASLCDCQALVCQPGLRWDPMNLLRGCGLSVLEFDHLVTAQVPFQPYHVATAQSYVMDLSAGYPAYLEERLRGSRKSLRLTFRKQQDLEAQVGEIAFEFHSCDPCDLRTLMAWKSAQFRRSGWPDRFAQPWVRRLISDLFESDSPGCAGTLSVLRAGGRPVALLYGLRSPTVLALWFPTYNPDFARYSPGLILHLQVAEAAARLGVREIDLGKGQEWYKDKLKSRDVDLAEAWVALPTAGALLRRLERAPRRHLWGFVLRHQRLRRAARWTLRQVMWTRPAR